MKVIENKEILEKLDSVIERVWIEEFGYNTTFYIAHIEFKDNARYLDRKFTSTNREESGEKMLEYLIDNNLLPKGSADMGS